MERDRAIHPLANQIPEMLTDEYADLVADIKANGLKQPIVLFENKILDGRHRYKACIELGITPDTVELPGTPTSGISRVPPTKEQAKAFVTSLNVHRRHLTFEQKQKIVHAELKREPTQSDRTIAKKAKTSPTTVGKVRAELVAAGEVSTVDSSTGADGKVRPRPPKSTALIAHEPGEPLLWCDAPDPRSDRTKRAEAKAAARRVTAEMDLLAEQIVKQLERINVFNLTDPGWFAGQLHFHASRLNPHKLVFGKSNGADVQRKETSP